MEINELEKDVLQVFSDYDGHEAIFKITDEQTGLRAFIGVHNTNLGPALGGCRMTRYESEEAAIRDVLRLSRGMTYKNALAGLPLGGGKAVIIGNPYEEKTEALIQAMGRAVDSLKGRYITAEDSGTNEKDMITMRGETDYVVGIRSAEGRRLGGDPSPFTAYGVFKGLKAAVKHRYGKDTVDGLTVAVQGLGAVGYGLCRHLADEGASLIVTDVREAVLAKAQGDFETIKVVAPEEIFGVDADIFSPCALGAQVNDETIPQLKVDIIAGAANNQLQTAAHENLLAEKNILYVPDYAINAGGVIAACYEYFMRTGSNPFTHEITYDTMMAHVDSIDQTIMKIFNIAESRGISTGQAADQLAEAIFAGHEDDFGFKTVAS